MADLQTSVSNDENGLNVDDENTIIRLANRIAKKDLKLIANKRDEVSSFDEARIVTAYKQAAVRSKGEARQALNGMDLDGLDPREVEALAIEMSRAAKSSDEADDE